ncbi:MAG: erythromycin esterase family protein [Deltaproteobacteria bacterium]|nr:erythromycin esterase family protein [Deltaproteobacteria bacterium]
MKANDDLLRLTRRRWHLAALAAICLGACSGQSDLSMDAGVDALGLADAASTTRLDQSRSEDAAAITPQESYPLSGELPTNAELRPLARLIGSAEVVGLGEATHGSSGLHRLRARVVQFLVEEVGFRALAFEADWYGAESIDAYTRGGRCDDAGAQRAVEALSHDAWLSADIRTLLTWLCLHNQRAPADTVRVIGIDVQRPYHHRAALAEMLAAAKVADRDALLDQLAGCFGVDFSSAYEVYALPYDSRGAPACAAGIDALQKRIDDNQVAYAAEAGPDQLLRARIALRALRAFQGLVASSDKPLEARDEGMADLLELGIKRAGNPKTIVWAANSHLARNHGDVSQTLGGGTYAYSGQRGLGTNLAERYKTKYVAVGASAGSLGLSLNTHHWNLELGTTPNTFVSRLSALGAGALVDLHYPAPQLWQPKTPYGIVFFGRPRLARVEEQFDAFLYLARSAPLENAFAAGLEGPFERDLGTVLGTDAQRSESVVSSASIPVRDLIVRHKTDDALLTFLFRFAQGIAPTTNTAYPLHKAERMAIFVQRQFVGDSAVQQFVAVSGNLTVSRWDYPNQVTLKLEQATFAALVPGRFVIDGPRIRLARLDADMKF